MTFFAHKLVTTSFKCSKRLECGEDSGMEGHVSKQASRPRPAFFWDSMHFRPNDAFKGRPLSSFHFLFVLTGLRDVRLWADVVILRVKDKQWMRSQDTLLRSCLYFLCSQTFVLERDQRLKDQDQRIVNIRHQPVELCAMTFLSQKCPCPFM